MKNSINIVLVLSLVLTSCTIQKRRYSKGFTITKNKKYSFLNKSNKENTNSNNIAKIKFNTTPSSIKSRTIFSKIVLSNKVKNTYTKSKNVKNFESLLTKLDTSNNIETPINTNNININSNKSELEPEPRSDQEKIYNKSSIIALVCLLIPIGGFIAALILGFKALIEIKKYPNKYRKGSKLMAIIAVIPFYLMLGGIIAIFLSSITFFGGLSIIIASILILIGLIPIFILLISKRPKMEANNKTPNTKKDNTKITSQNKLLISLIILFSAFLLIPLTFNM